MLKHALRLCGRQVVQDRQVELDRRTGVGPLLTGQRHRWYFVLGYGQGEVVGSIHRLFSSFPGPSGSFSLLSRWYCSANIRFAREMRVAAAFGEMPIMMAIS